MMNKIIKLVICLMLFTGCQVQDNKTINVNREELAVYEQGLHKILNNTNEYYDYTKTFDIKVTFVKSEDYYNYTMILDNPKIEMRSIILIAYSAFSKDKVHPSIGIFDSMSYSLVPGVIDKENGFYKGIGLSGTVSHKSDIFVFLSYYPKDDESNRIERLIKVKL